MDARRARAELQKLVMDWDRDINDPRDRYSYRLLLDELLYHSDLRYSDYVQFKDTEGPFPVRLKQWIDNMSNKRDKQLLFRLLSYFIFVDTTQMRSLYRDAYRRVVAPWLEQGLGSNDLLDPNYPSAIVGRLRRYPLYSITESFGFSGFLHLNNLVGLPKPIIFGDSRARARAMLPARDADIDGLIVFEDIVGTGGQAARILDELRQHGNPAWRSLFVPLICLYDGNTTLRNKIDGEAISVRPVFVVDEAHCITASPRRAEPDEFKSLRTLIRQTAGRVLERLNPVDVPPTNAFGYKGSGSVLTTYHNTPNNSLPLIHHKAPDWFPLFRRVHHAS